MFVNNRLRTSGRGPSGPARFRSRRRRGPARERSPGDGPDEGRARPGTAGRARGPGSGSIGRPRRRSRSSPRVLWPAGLGAASDLAGPDPVAGHRRRPSSPRSRQGRPGDPQPGDASSSSIPTTWRPWSGSPGSGPIRRGTVDEAMRGRGGQRPAPPQGPRGPRPPGDPAEAGRRSTSAAATRTAPAPTHRLTPEAAVYDLKYRAAEADRPRPGPSGPARRPSPGTTGSWPWRWRGWRSRATRRRWTSRSREYEAALKGDPGDVVAAERLARLCRERLGDPARGERVLDDLRGPRPDSPEVRLVRYRYFAEDPPQATWRLSSWRRPPRLAPGDLDVRLTAASDALRRGDTAAARRQVEAIPESLQGDLRVRVMRGMIDFGEERPDEAIDGWRQGLLTIGGTDADLTWWLAHALLQMGRVSEARPLVAQYRRLAGGEAQQPLYRFLQAELDEKTGRPARRHRSAWSGPGTGSASTGGRWSRSPWAAATRRSGTGPKALEAYRRASQIDPRHGRAPGRRRPAPDGRTGPTRRSGRSSGAWPMAPDEPSLRFALADARLRQQAGPAPAGERDWADFDRALERAGEGSRPANSSLLLMRADRLALGGRPRRGDRPPGGGRSGSPRNARALDGLGRGTGPRPAGPLEALEVLDRAAGARAAGDRAPIRIARARLLLGLGRGREAREGPAWRRGGACRSATARPSGRPWAGSTPPGATIGRPGPRSPNGPGSCPTTPGPASPCSSWPRPPATRRPSAPPSRPSGRSAAPRTSPGGSAAPRSCSGALALRPGRPPPGATPGSWRPPAPRRGSWPTPPNCPPPTCSSARSWSGSGGPTRPSPPIGAPGTGGSSGPSPGWSSS